MCFIANEVFKKIVCKVRLLDLLFIRLEISVEVLIFKTIGDHQTDSPINDHRLSVSAINYGIMAISIMDVMVRFDQKQCVVNFHFKTYYDRQKCPSMNHDVDLDMCDLITLF